MLLLKPTFQIISFIYSLVQTHLTVMLGIISHNLIHINNVIYVMTCMCVCISTRISSEQK
jgi:hypothetical protein